MAGLHVRGIGIAGASLLFLGGAPADVFGFVEDMMTYSKSDMDAIQWFVAYYPDKTEAREILEVLSQLRAVGGDQYGRFVESLKQNAQVLIAKREKAPKWWKQPVSLDPAQTNEFTIATR